MKQLAVFIKPLPMLALIVACGLLLLHYVQYAAICGFTWLAIVALSAARDGEAS